MLSVIMLSVIMLSVIMLSVVILNVAAPDLICSGNTKGKSVTVPLTSCLTGSD